MLGKMKNPGHTNINCNVSPCKFYFEGKCTRYTITIEDGRCMNVKPSHFRSYLNHMYSAGPMIK
jgi:hypothetical protein